MLEKKFIFIIIFIFGQNIVVSQNYIFRIDTLDYAIIGDSLVLQINANKKINILTTKFNPSKLDDEYFNLKYGDTNIKWKELLPLAIIEAKNKSIYIDSFGSKLIFDTFFNQKIKFYNYYTKIVFYNSKIGLCDTFHVIMESTSNRRDFEAHIKKYSTYFIFENKNQGPWYDDAFIQKHPVTRNEDNILSFDENT